MLISEGHALGAQSSGGGSFTIGAGAAVAAPAGSPAPGATTPDVAALAGDLAENELVWEACDFAYHPSLDGIDISNMQCATIQVPQDWHDADPEKT